MEIPVHARLKTRHPRKIHDVTIIRNLCSVFEDPMKTITIKFPVELHTNDGLFSVRKTRVLIE